MRPRAAAQHWSGGKVRVSRAWVGAGSDAACGKSLDEDVGDVVGPADVCNALCRKLKIFMSAESMKK